MSANYKAGQREFAAWLSDNGIRLRKCDELGLQDDSDGWGHFAWTVHVSGLDGETYEFPFKQGIAHTKRPTLVDIMASLLRDANGLHSSFENWADEYGYDHDSRSALATFDLIAVHNGRLVKMFGRPLEDIVRQSEALLDEAGL